MVHRTALMTLLLTLAVAASARAVTIVPSLDTTSDSVIISVSSQILAVRLADGSLKLDTPYASRELFAYINSPSGWVHPGQSSIPPKLHRGKDSVAALITFGVPGERKMTLHVDAYPGVDAVFVTSGLTGQFNASRDCYFWSWKQSDTYEITRLPNNDDVFVPNESGGLLVMTSGTFSNTSDEAHINALPKSRFLRPDETLDIGFGLAGAADASQAAALSKLSHTKPIAALKRFYITKNAKIDYGAPAPDWLRNIDAFIGNTSGLLIVDAPASTSIIKNAHDSGSRVIVRVNYMQNIDLAQHPDWACVDFDGRATDLPCLHNYDLRQSVLTDVCNIMNLGADGVFIDGASPIRDCFGATLCKHSHTDAAKTNTEAYELLQREIYKLVKTFGDDKIVMRDSGIAPLHWSYCDAQVWDCADFSDWAELQYAVKEHAEAVRRGKAPVILCSSCASCAYAYARLYDWLAADFTNKEKWASSIHLGKPLSAAKPIGDMLYRAFENGMVVLNPTKVKASLLVPTLRDGRIYDVVYGRELNALDSCAEIDMLPESGRVFLWRD